MTPDPAPTPDTIRTPSSQRISTHALRRWHSASGGVFAVFLAVHFCVNASSWYPPFFATVVGTIHAVIDTVPGITLALVFLPLSVQIATGLYLLHLDGLGYQPRECNRGSTPRFFLQRISALILLGFVTLHLGTLHGWGLHAVMRKLPGRLAGYDPTHVFPQMGALGALLFLVGVGAMVYHLANGAITAGHLWGFIETKRERRGWRRLCTAMGVLALIVGTGAWLGFGCAGWLAR